MGTDLNQTQSATDANRIGSVAADTYRTQSVAEDASRNQSVVTNNKMEFA